MDMFAKFKKAHDHIKSDESDINLNRGEDSRFINHEGDFVLKVEKIKHGISENKSNPNTYKKPYVILEARVERVNYQDQNAEKPVSEGELVAIYHRLPREDDPELMTVAEQYQIADMCETIGALLGLEGSAVDLSQVGPLFADDGAALKGTLLGCAYVESKPNKDTGRTYINSRPYPVDGDPASETYLERIKAMTEEEAAEL